MKRLPYAEDCNYWKTSQSSPDSWLEKCAVMIEKIGGKVVTYAYGSDPQSQREAYLFLFDLEGSRYKIVWPILPVRSGKDNLAAKRQAATLMYHDIKNKCLTCRIKGMQHTFFEYLLLADGPTAPEATYKELLHGLPAVFSNFQALPAKEIRYEIQSDKA